MKIFAVETQIKKELGEREEGNEYYVFRKVFCIHNFQIINQFQIIIFSLHTHKHRNIFIYIYIFILIIFLLL